MAGSLHRLSTAKFCFVVKGLVHKMSLIVTIVQRLPNKVHWREFDTPLPCIAILNQLFNTIPSPQCFLFLFQESDAAGGRLVVGLPRHPRLVQRRARLPHPQQPVEERLGRHDARPQDIRPRVRARGTPEADDQHHRRPADLPDRLDRGPELGRGEQPDPRPQAEAVEARAQTAGREGAHIRVGEW